MKNNKLQTQMTEIAREYGVTLKTCVNRSGSVFTTPEWEEWPEELFDAITLVAEMRRGPADDYFVARSSDES